MSCAFQVGVRYRRRCCSRILYCLNAHLFQWTVLLLLCGAEINSGASIHHIVVRDPSPSLPLATDLSLSRGLKKMRAQSPASSSDFVGAVIEGLSSEALGSGLVAKTILTVLKFFLSNLAAILPVEVVEYFMGRPLLMEDVAFFEVMVRDTLEIYTAWSNQP